MASRRGVKSNEIQKELDFDYTNCKTMNVKDYFIEYLFPDAIIYGMSYDEFWFKDPELFFSYRFSYLKSVEIERERINYTAWLNGLYNYEAHSLSLANAFGDKKTVKQNYPDKPHDLNGNKKVNTEEEFLGVRNFWSRFKERSKR